MTTKPKPMKITFCASPRPDPQAALNYMITRYGQSRPSKADVVVAMGGDGTMIYALHHYALKYDLPVYGINWGHRGFLLNTRKSNDTDLIESIKKANAISLSPLCVEYLGKAGSIVKSFAVNEVLICNHYRQKTTILDVIVDGDPYLTKANGAAVQGDGLLIASAIGSTGYSRSAGGPPVSLSRDAMIITPSNCCSIPKPLANVIDPARIKVSVVEPQFNKTDLYTDQSVRPLAKNIHDVEVTIDESRKMRLLCDADYNRRRRVMLIGVDR